MTIQTSEKEKYETNTILEENDTIRKELAMNSVKSEQAERSESHWHNFKCKGKLKYKHDFNCSCTTGNNEKERLKKDKHISSGYNRNNFGNRLLNKVLTLLKIKDEPKAFLTEIPLRKSLVKSNFSFQQNFNQADFDSSAMMLIYDKTKPLESIGFSTFSKIASGDHKSILSKKENNLYNIETLRVLESEEKKLDDFLLDLKSAERDRYHNFIQLKIIRNQQIQQYYDQNGEFLIM